MMRSGLVGVVEEHIGSMLLRNRKEVELGCKIKNGGPGRQGSRARGS